ncbi:hypothetical protein PVAND_010360 [Polypedilum vanderplanki]|uniref:C2H2-type domain-containing protein n=1 Tax=Polypedilum vanderplanki TaxID=319348 RepID=A0A9J6CFB3_POLVA|nr:hypothetical protein PVAND_010360 [Polypedilum vanderplanki]
MDNQCIFRGCKRQSEDYFYSPSDPLLLQKWQKAANTKQKNFCVCIDHFRKCDIIVERNLEEFAIPIQNAMKQDIRVDRYCCGSCLKDLGNQVTSPTKEIMKNFYDITEYHLVTEVLCFQCAQFLKIFSRFKNEIKQHHKELRLQSNPEDYVPGREMKIKRIEMSLPNKNVLRVCRHCPYKTYDKDAYFLHLCTVHEETTPGMSIKISSTTTNDLGPVECFHCRKKFANDASLQIHQTLNHPKQRVKKPSPTPVPTSEKTTSFVIKSPRSLSGGSNLEQRRLQLIAKLENTAKRRPPIPEPIPTISIPTPAVTTRTSSQTIKKQNYNFEIFELGDELINLKQETEVKEEEPDDISAVEIRNIEDILRQENKNKRKQNIAKKQDETEIVFKEEPEDEEEEEELVVAEIVEEQSDEASENENESLNYIPPPKKSLATTSNFNKQVQCLDCKEFMSFEELADHRDAMHTQKDNQFYDDIRYSDLPPPKKKYKTKQVKSTAQVTCTICSKVMQEWKLEKHKELFHSDKAMQFLCHICCKSFPQITMFKYHMVSHDPDLQYRCDLCGAGFITKSKMLRHIKRVHMNIYQPRGVCSICNQKIYKSHRVKTHMEKYHPNGLDEGFRVNPETNYFDCHRCGASYADLYTFKRHDCGKGRFQLRCPDCGKPVKNEEFLQRHQETKCPILNKHSVLNKKLNVTI